MSAPLRVEVQVRGVLTGDLLGLVGDLGARPVPRHTVLTVGAVPGDGPHPDDEDAGEAAAAALTRLLEGLGRSGVEVDRVLTCPGRSAGAGGPAAG